MFFVTLLSSLAAPITTHATGKEHIVLLNTSHPLTPTLEKVLATLSLSPSHKDVLHIYNNTAFVGFSAKMNTHCLSLLSNTSYVTHLEPATRLTHSSLSTLPDSPWGLQRLSTSSATIQGDTANLNYTYTYTSPLLGQAANIYILDTGVFTRHIVFGGRARMGWSFDGLATDDDGHGTHVAGIAAGVRVGVAQAANIIGVRVLGSTGGGWSSDVVKGVDWAISQHTNASVSASSAGSILSLSLSSSAQVPALDAALKAAHDAGIHVVTAAGNAASDACSSSPSDMGGDTGPAIVVGSVGPTDATISSFSNTGPCVDVYAAGEGVVSSWPPLDYLSAVASSGSGVDVGTSLADNNEVKSLDGTSMATPFVAGLVAYAVAGNSTLAASPTLMKEWVRQVALKGMVKVGDGETVVEGDEGLLASNGVVSILETEEADANDAQHNAAGENGGSRRSSGSGIIGFKSCSYDEQ